MKHTNYILIFLILVSCPTSKKLTERSSQPTKFVFKKSIVSSQSRTTDIQEISETLILYIDGAQNGKPEKLKKAFYPDFNLYKVTEEDSLRIRSGAQHVSNVKEGKKSNRIGRIISIDYENDAAIAKVEILVLNRIYTDYFLLLKYEGAWKIVDKSYTMKPTQI